MKVIGHTSATILLMFYITTNNSINYKNTYKNTSTIMIAAILENSITEKINTSV